MNPANGGWVILLSIVVALILSVLHAPESWPGWLGWLRPNWLLMVVFFWVMELPARFGLIVAWLLGLIVDALLADPLGLNGFILAGVTYVAWRFFERLRMYALVQQCGVLFLLVLGAELTRMSAYVLISERQWSWLVLLIPVMTTLVWPLIYLLLLRVKLAARVE